MKVTNVLGLPQAFVDADVVLADIDSLDITNKSATEKFISDCAPDVVINCAAYTNVDGCESNQDTAFMVNGIGSRNLAIACENVGAKLVHVSTDYVFKGDEPTPRREYDVTNPISVYGKQKMQAKNLFVSTAKNPLSFAQPGCMATLAKTL